MDLIHGIVNAFTPLHLLFCFLGCLLGTLVGVLPGLGAASTLAILLPVTMYLSPTGSIIMLAGLYYGAQYGGSTTSILINIPGEAASVATCFDGFEMTKRGRAGEALWIAAVGSFMAGTLGAVAISLIGPEIAKYALQFGPPEYFGLLFISLTSLVTLSGASLARGMAAGVAGLLLATVGPDQMTGAPRFSYGSTALLSGFDILPLAVGLFGIAEILVNMDEGTARIYEGKLGRMMPRGGELRRGLLASLRGSLLFPLGVLPGMVSSITAFLAYDIEKRISRQPEKFGTGVIEGVAAPEAANNATCMAGLIPLMAFGIPTGPSWAIVLAALVMYGLQPGPLLFQSNPEFVWTVIGSLYVGNVILLVLNLPLVGLWARLATVPYKYLAPGVLGICLVGAYSPRNSMFDVWTAIAAGVVGYVMRKYAWPIAPLLLGFILGPMFEQSLRQSLSMGGLAIFVLRPLSISFIVLGVVLTILLLRYLRKAEAA